MRNIFTSTPLHKPHCVCRWLIPIGIGIPRHYALCIMDWLRIHQPVCSIYWSFEFEMVCLLGSCLTGGPWLGVCSCVCVKICMQTIRWEQKKRLDCRCLRNYLHNVAGIESVKWHKNEQKSYEGMEMPWKISDVNHVRVLKTGTKRQDGNGAEKEPQNQGVERGAFESREKT